MAVELVASAAVAPDIAAGVTSDDAMRALVVWMTCVVDGREHAVTDDRASQAMERGDGMYDAVCDQRIAPQSLTCEPGPCCAECCTRLAAPVAAARRTEGRRWLPPRRRGRGR